MKEKSKSYSHIVIWQKSYILAIEVYRITIQFPKEEIFGLTSRIRRAVNLIPANLAEDIKMNQDQLPFSTNY
jgi:four helix bundle protein